MEETTPTHPEQVTPPPELFMYGTNRSSILAISFEDFSCPSVFLCKIPQRVGHRRVLSNTDTGVFERQEASERSTLPQHNE